MSNITRPRWMEVTDASVGVSTGATPRSYVQLTLLDVGSIRRKNGSVERTVRLWRWHERDSLEKARAVEARFAYYMRGFGLTWPEGGRSVMTRELIRSACCQFERSSIGPTFERFDLYKVRQREVVPQAFCAGCTVNGPAPDTLCSKCFSLFIEWAGTRAQRMTREDNCTLYALGPALDQWLEAGGVKALDAAKVAKDAMLDQWGDVMRRTM